MQGKDKDRKQKDRKEQEQESQNDSDGHSDSASGESNNSPVHSSNKAHVEFSEAEVISEEVTNAKVCCWLFRLRVKFLILFLLNRNHLANGIKIVRIARRSHPAPAF